MTSQLDRIIAESGPRMVGDGVFYMDLLRIQNRLQDWSGWFAAWAELADKYEEMGEAAQESGFKITAGEMFWQSCICWQYSQFLWFEHPDERVLGQRRKVELYRRAAPLLEPAAERLEIPFEDTMIPAWLRLPQGERPAPCVVLIGGLESTKEESYHFENLCLRRGLATVAFDGPGQGEYFFQRPIVPDFERYTSAVVDYLQDRPEIDRRRLAVLGRSLGGHYAIRSAAFEPRFRACVDWGGAFDLSNLEHRAPENRRGWRYVTGLDDPAAAEEKARRCIDLGPIVDQLRELTTPVYIMHGALDNLAPVSHAERLIGLLAKAPKTVAIEPQGDHCGHNMHHLVRRPIADWLAQQLAPTGGSLRRHPVGAGG